MILWGLVVSYGFPLLRGQPLPGSLASQKAKAGETGVLAVNLPNGGKAELLAVSHQHAAPNQWWRPDGTLVTNARVEVMNEPAYAAQEKMLRHLIFRIDDLPRDASGPFFEVEPEGSYASGGTVLINDKELAGGVALRIGVTPGTKVARVRLGLGLTPWRTIGRYGVDPRSTSYERQEGDPAWHFSFQALTATVGGAQLTVVMPPEDRGWKTRLVATDTNGVEYPTTVSEGTPQEKVQIWTYRFDGLPLYQIREFRFQVQPVHWVQFDEVRLHALEPLPESKRVTFAATTELRFDSFIDFDTAKTAEPTSDSSKNPLVGIAETVTWMEREGMDAAASRDGLQPLGMVFAVVENADWSRLTPEDVPNRLRDGMFRPSRLTPLNDELPSTFVFETREGGIGVLQLCGLAEPGQPGISLRYKLIQRPALPTP
jgi:hypothetical protein